MRVPRENSEKLIQELAWRDYWQQVWIAKGDAIHTDIKSPQNNASNYALPYAIKNACTGIVAVDNAIKELYRTGYMHNHMRMYVASICCNIAHSHWLVPARWMYAHLLDGDPASNQLSWQWVAGTFSNKKYYANQDNINTYFTSSQKSTFLDVGYDEFAELSTPEVLRDTVPLNMDTSLPNIVNPTLARHKPTLIYNYFNLDTQWHEHRDMQRVLLLEPSHFLQHPVSKSCIDFVLALSLNIPNIRLFVGEFSELMNQLDAKDIIYKEHPLNKHYQGTEEPRDWLSSAAGYYPSFFTFWKECKKELL